MVLSLTPKCRDCADAGAHVGEAPDPAIVEKATQAFHREATVLDTHLGRQPYLIGGEPTLADFSVAAPLAYSREAQLPVEPYRHVQDWSGRVFALPAWHETAPTPAPPRPRLD